jgi:hypothetical protein
MPMPHGIVAQAFLPVPIVESEYLTASKGTVTTGSQGNSR